MFQQSCHTNNSSNLDVHQVCSYNESPIPYDELQAKFKSLKLTSLELEARCKSYKAEIEALGYFCYIHKQQNHNLTENLQKYEKELTKSKLLLASKEEDTDSGPSTSELKLQVVLFQNELQLLKNNLTENNLHNEANENKIQRQIGSIHQLENRLFTSETMLSQTNKINEELQNQVLLLETQLQFSKITIECLRNNLSISESRHEQDIKEFHSKQSIYTRQLEQANKMIEVMKSMMSASDIHLEEVTRTTEVTQSLFDISKVQLECAKNAVVVSEDKLKQANITIEEMQSKITKSELQLKHDEKVIRDSFEIQLKHANKRIEDLSKIIDSKTTRDDECKGDNINQSHRKKRLIEGSTNIKKFNSKCEDYTQYYKSETHTRKRARIKLESDTNMNCFTTSKNGRPLRKAVLQVQGKSVYTRSGIPSDIQGDYEETIFGKNHVDNIKTSKRIKDFPKPSTKRYIVSKILENKIYKGKAEELKSKPRSYFYVGQPRPSSSVYNVNEGCEKKVPLDWSIHYAALVEYGKEYGTCNIPTTRGYECEIPSMGVNGRPYHYKANLGNWVHTQRKINRGTSPTSRIIPERVAQLQNLVDEGKFSWSPENPAQRQKTIGLKTWPIHYAALMKYYKIHGTCNVPHERYFECELPGMGENGDVYHYKANLGTWLGNQRAAKKGRGKYVIRPHQVAKLQKLVDQGKLTWIPKWGYHGKNSSITTVCIPDPVPNTSSSKCTSIATSSSSKALSLIKVTPKKTGKKKPVSIKSKVTVKNI